MRQRVWALWLFDFLILLGPVVAGRGNDIIGCEKDRYYFNQKRIFKKDRFWMKQDQAWGRGGGLLNELQQT